jgi:hypothetical protein
MDNRINTTLTDESLAEIRQLFADLRGKMSFLIDLSEDERQALFKMGAKSQEFVRTAANVAEQNLDILPRKFDPAELRSDVTLYDQLAALLPEARKLVELMDDTLMLVGSEAMAGALVVYGATQLHGKGEALDSSLDGLAKRFKRKSGGANEVPPPATT